MNAIYYIYFYETERKREIELENCLKLDDQNGILHLAKSVLFQ